MREFVFVPPLAPVRPPKRKPGQKMFSPRHYASRKDGFPAQDVVICYIEGRKAAGQPAPSLEEIQAHMGWEHVSAVKSCLKRMAARGVMPEGFQWP